jgi:lysophospholipase L1-like esterase
VQRRAVVANVIDASHRPARRRSGARWTSDPGTNDIADGLPVARVVEEYKRFVRTGHQTLPDTRVAFVSAAPNPARWHLRRSMQRLNREVAGYSRTNPRLDYIDVWRPMLGSNGEPRPDIFVEDRLHMNEKGYDIWKQVIGRYLQQVWRSEAA